MKIEITEKELNTIFKDKVLDYMKEKLDDSMLEYWVRDQIHKIIGREVVDEFIKKNYTPEKLREILKEAFQNHVREKFE